jgi:Protein of unknown function (DUF1553)/Protein of unknown function (DUF1549)/Planctomycete cytochrome C
MVIGKRRVPRFDWLLIPCLLWFSSVGVVSAGEKVEYNRDVRPILSENCFFCHGPDKAHRKSGLRLDVRDAALEDAAFVPGDPNKSELVIRITTKDADGLMPPASTHKTLTANQIDVLRRWIAEGAEYQPHWSYVKVTRPVLPPANVAATTVDNPIDRFVDATLAAKGLQSAQPASPSVLVRRLALDLVGLPPSPNEVAGFAKRAMGNFQKAYREEVKRLLASPHYGERMAVPWLDVVRYADTVGYHGDQNQNVFPYRDYVIAAFNQNKRFDVFTTEQIAGDLLPSATVEQKTATGFNRLNMVTREGGAQAKEYLAKYMGDRVRAIGTAFLGSTLGCAECHDHKYDPILARDFYAMGAFFADVREWGVYADYEYTPVPDLAGVGNDDPFPPELMVDSPAEKTRATALRAEIAAASQQVMTAAFRNPAARQVFSAWTSEVKQFLKANPTGAWTLSPKPGQISSSVDEVKLSIEGDAVVLQGKSIASSTTVAIDRDSVAKGLSSIASVRIELIPTETHKGSILREGSTSDPIYISFKVLRADSEDGRRKESKLGVRVSNASDPVPSYRNGFPRFDLKDGWRVVRQHLSTRQVSEFEFSQPLTLATGEVLMVVVHAEDLGAFRVSLSPFASQTSLEVPSIAAAAVDSPKGWPAFLRKALARPSGAALRGLHEIYIRSTNIDPKGLSQIDRLARELSLSRDGRVPTLVTVSQSPRPIRVLPRGNWQDDSGPIVEPAPPSFLPGWDSIRPTGRPTRLDLARWLTSRDNPLTARTFMNRLWRQFFGVGLSSVLDDLGAQGENPSHPALLDWLAAEFMESGWDVKHMVELIVTSRVYQKSSHVPPSLLAIDPDNRLLARQSQRRLDAEFVRDNALSIAGLINLSMGGAAIKPYQPEGYYDNLEFPQRQYEANTDARQFRRGIYTHWQRTFVHPAMANFDAPSREECTANRPASNTPQQALTLLNDPTFVESARVFAGRTLLENPRASDAMRIAFAFVRALGRPPTEAETASLQTLLTEQRRYFAGHVEAARVLTSVGISPPIAIDPVEHAAWTAIGRVILNLYETVTRL